MVEIAPHASLVNGIIQPALKETKEGFSSLLIKMQVLLGTLISIYALAHAQQRGCVFEEVVKIA